jgi:hypothetical protein
MHHGKKKIYTRVQLNNFFDKTQRAREQREIEIEQKLRNKVYS